MEEKYRKIYLDNVHQFAREFKQDSAYLINRFLNGYSKDKVRKIFEILQSHSADKTSKSESEDWINHSVKSYKPINTQYIDMLKYFALYMSQQEPLSQPMTVWRGCDTLEDGAMTGLVATSTKRETAEGFNYGTLVKINLPAGMKVVKYGEINNEEDIENEVILPPCDYVIKSESMANVGGRDTRVVEVDVQPRDLLREFAIAMNQPARDYIVENGIDDAYKTAYAYLSMMLVQRTIFNCVSSEKIEGTCLHGGIDSVRKKSIDNSKCDGKTNMHNAFMLMHSNQVLPMHLATAMRERAVRKPGIPKQITTQQFFEYVRTSKHQGVFRDYENMSGHEKYYVHADHGVRHADNVTMFTYYIASKEGYTDDGVRILMEAARYHDIGRTNSWQEGGHGLAGAKRYAMDHKTQIPLYEQQIIGFLIQAHDLPTREDIRILANKLLRYCNDSQIDMLCDMANILRDADALDRTRFPIYSQDYLNSTLLTHDSSRELIEVAQTINHREIQLSNRQKNNKTSTKGKKNGVNFGEDNNPR